VDCLNRAHISASAAISAGFWINFVDITFRDSFYRAFIDTGSASRAIIINFISHDLLILRPVFPGQVNKAIFVAKIKIFPDFTY
jgi:hypothetical protein